MLGKPSIFSHNHNSKSIVLFLIMKNIVFTFFCCCLLAISCLGATNSVKKARKQKCNIVAVSCKDNSRKYAENKAYVTKFDLCSHKNNYIFDATKFHASNASMPVS